MPEYSNISKSKVFKTILKKLENRYGLEISQGGKHNLRVTSIETNETYPIPCNHKEINVHIIKDFVHWLGVNKVCSKKEFIDLM